MITSGAWKTGATGWRKSLPFQPTKRQRSAAVFEIQGLRPPGRAASLGLSRNKSNEMARWVPSSR